MTSEEDFQRALDEHPDDWQTRLVFADWLQERGDVRAEGYRALGVLRLWPYRWRNPPEERAYRWLFHNGDGNESGRPIPKCHVLPKDWLNKTAGRKPKEYLALLMEYDIAAEVPAPRQVLEDAVAVAFAKLPAKRRAELLAAPAPTASKEPNEQTAGARKRMPKPETRGRRNKRGSNKP